MSEINDSVNRTEYAAPKTESNGIKINSKEIFNIPPHQIILLNILVISKFSIICIPRILLTNTLNGIKQIISNTFIAG